jgi:hypothetical protein
MIESERGGPAERWQKYNRSAGGIGGAALSPIRSFQV